MLTTIVYSTLLSIVFVYVYFLQEQTYNEQPLTEATSPVKDEEQQLTPEQDAALTEWLSTAYGDDEPQVTEATCTVDVPFEYWTAQQEIDIMLLAKEYEANNTIRELKAKASAAHIKGYGNMTKEVLAQALATIPLG